MTRTEIEALLARVRVATGHSRQTDAEIFNAAHNATGGWIGQNWYVDFGHGSMISTLSAYTASLDAIVGLIEQTWPHIAKSVSGPPWDVELHMFINPNWMVRERAETEALALCAAFLSALIRTSALNRSKSSRSMSPLPDEAGG